MLKYEPSIGYQLLWGCCPSHFHILAYTYFGTTGTVQYLRACDTRTERRMKKTSMNTIYDWDVDMGNENISDQERCSVTTLV